jgi:hypothetical protein
MPGKRVQFDDETLRALNLLARDRMQDFQELAEEAFGDLLRKHRHPTDLKCALRRSADADRGEQGRPKSNRPVADLIQALQASNAAGKRSANVR